MGLFVELMNPNTGIRQIPIRKKPYGMPSFCLKFSHFSCQFHWHIQSTINAMPMGHMKKVVKGSKAIISIITV